MSHIASSNGDNDDYSHELELREEDPEKKKRQQKPKSINLVNRDLSMIYSQQNMEKAICLLLIIIFLCLLGIYNYKSLMNKFLFYLICSSLILDTFLILIYFFMWCRVYFSDSSSVGLFFFVDYVIIFDSIIKILVIIFLFIYYKKLGFVILFLFKLILECYLMVSCSKVLTFKPNYACIYEYVEEFVEKLKIIVNCCETNNEDEEANPIDCNYNPVSESEI